jgi:phosphonate transport system substrate-binding protein
MSEASGSTSHPRVPGAGGLASSGTARLLARTALYLGLAVAVAVIAYAQYRSTQEQAAMRAAQERLVAMRGLVQPERKRLAPAYADADGGLLADPPADPGKLLDPDTLVLAHYEGDDDDTQRVVWEAFQKHLAEATGKSVELEEYVNSADDIAAIASGATQIIALHAADVPYIVNNAGFIPLAVLGTEAAASGNHLTIAVGSKSKCRSLADLRGRKLTCTRPDSITGYRAAIAMIAHEAGLRPDVDYRIHFSHGQRRSVEGLVGGQFEIAALSDDKLKSMLKEGEVKASDYRVIYESQVIPRLTIGYAHSLKPELAAKVTAAILSFQNEGGLTDESTGKPMRFLPIDYKKDFEFVRKIDDYFDPRFGKVASAKLTP